MGNAEATKERILEAAMEEFSSYGIAGARVDRIAKKANCNKNMIYIYFENKETLFTTVLQNNLQRVYEEITFTPDDLPGYAVKVFDFAIAHPELYRLLAWYSLEQHTVNLAERTLVQQKKITEVVQAQASGLVGTTFTPGFLLTAIMVLATAWTPINPFGPSYEPNALKMPAETREAVFQAVSLLAKA
ncbi:TetR/AcrR family transcriptional regulator [Propionispora vibrioides]|uniref:DNA-binding transcriptional regulator, AcrR family n=1 Tax=Propionispora vibrioides TaxID=112903 RepID=A0A1H8XPR0_9FIRM|nr:TetR/AcrR family transcriptional regulator [Propionispora vibrioides]SEP41807.1 DNA-binding transcriptional regulator, AcrR family [Propionispora vibrioides]